MIHHLPECPLVNGCEHDYYPLPPIQCSDCGEVCICSALVACERRVNSEAAALLKLIQKDVAQEMEIKLKDFRMEVADRFSDVLTGAAMVDPADLSFGVR